MIEDYQIYKNSTTIPYTPKTNRVVEKVNDTIKLQDAPWG